MDRRESLLWTRERQALPRRRGGAGSNHEQAGRAAEGARRSGRQDVLNHIIGSPCGVRVRCQPLHFGTALQVTAHAPTWRYRAAATVCSSKVCASSHRENRHCSVPSLATAHSSTATALGVSRACPSQISARLADTNCSHSRWPSSQTAVTLQHVSVRAILPTPTDGSRSRTLMIWFTSTLSSLLSSTRGDPARRSGPRFALRHAIVAAWRWDHIGSEPRDSVVSP